MNSTYAHAGPNRKIFSHYSRLRFSAVHRRRIRRFAFHLLVLILHKTAADNMSLHEWENFNAVYSLYTKLRLGGEYYSIRENSHISAIKTMNKS